MRKIDKQNIIGNPLTGDTKEFIIIPESVIINDDVDLKRVVTYIYFWLWSGKNKKVAYTVESLVSWCGYVPNSREGRINEQFEKIIYWLQDIGYISCQTNTSNLRYPHSTLLIADFHADWYQDKKENFAILYLDEINKIMDYDCGKKSKSLTNSNILLVFAYLRLQIRFRNNTEGESQEKRLSFPEVFYSYYKDISSTLGINEKTLSSILQILSKELGLIHMQRIKREESKGKDGVVKWITYPTFFCNTYKRLNGVLVYTGYNYYNFEIQNKIKKTNFGIFGKTNTKVEDCETDIDTEWLDKI